MAVCFYQRVLCSFNLKSLTSRVSASSLRRPLLQKQTSSSVACDDQTPRYCSSLSDDARFVGLNLCLNDIQHKSASLTLRRGCVMLSNAGHTNILTARTLPGCNFTGSTVSNTSLMSTETKSIQHTRTDVVKQTTPEDKTKPNLGQLQNIQNFMAVQIPVILSKRHEYRIYAKDVILQNNWDIDKPTTVVGISRYVVKVIKARIYVHLRYAMVKVSIVSSSINEEEGCVAVRWRVAGLQQSKAFMFWKYRPFRFKVTADREADWLEGVSTYYVNSRGFINKHVLDRVLLRDIEANEPKDSSTDKTAVDKD